MLGKPMTRTLTIAAAMATAFAIGSTAKGDEKTVSYNVAPGVCSPPIAVPANNRPVTVSGTQIAAQRVGAGQVTLMRSTQTPSLIWAGVDYYQGVERGYALINDTGTLIMFLDF